MSIVGRLAPSPTGPLHLGHAFAFTLAWAKARSQGGRVVLRFDDLDRARAHREFVDSALRDLAWLGLDWDGAPVFESSRRDRIEARALELEARGLAYACVCTRGELMDISAPHGAEPRYPGRCRGRFRDLESAAQETGRSAALRFSVEDGAVEFVDENFGPQSVDVATTVGDFPIRRRDGAPAYQLAVVVDDELDGVTEVVRGRDLLESTARQILLQRALGLTRPTTFHVPLICDATGKRLAKRDQARSLEELRMGGARPERIIAWIAQVTGQLDENEAERDEMTSAELCARFDPTKVGTHDIVAPTTARVVRR